MSENREQTHDRRRQLYVPEVELLQQPTDPTTTTLREGAGGDDDDSPIPSDCVLSPLLARPQHLAINNDRIIPAVPVMTNNQPIVENAEQRRTATTNNQSPARKLSKSRNVQLPAIRLHEIPPEGSSPRLISYELSDRVSHTRTISDDLPALNPRPVLHRGPNSSHHLLATSPVGGVLSRSRSSDDFSTLGYTRTGLSDSFHKSGEKVKAEEGEVIDIRIYYPNGKAVQFSAEDGVNARVDSLLQLMADYLGMEADVIGEALSLWMVSPLLELQLKAHHVAYEVHTKWPLFLETFTDANEQQAALDEPLLVIRRNFLLSVEREIQLCADYERLTELLYWSAREEYMSGRYLTDLETAMKLAALQMAIDYELFDDDNGVGKHSEAIELIRDNLAQLVPSQHLSTIRSFHLFGLAALECKAGLESAVVDEYKRVSHTYANKDLLRRAYLDLLHATPFYGAAFFNGTTEKRQGLLGRLTGQSPQMEVRVGINHEFITVVDPHRHELLLVQEIAKKPWLRSPDCDESDIPSLLLKFPSPGERASTKENSIKDVPAQATTERRNASAKKSIVDRRRVRFFKRMDAHRHRQPALINNLLSQSAKGKSASAGGGSSARVVVDEKQFTMVSRLVQIFSKQTIIMENMLDVVCADLNVMYGKLQICPVG